MSPKLWRNVAITGSALLVAIDAAGGNLASHIALLVAAVCACAAILTGVHTYKPRGVESWYGFFATAALFFFSNLLRTAAPILNQPFPQWPVLSNALDAAGFLAAAIASHRLGSVRDKDKDPTTVIDALILTGGGAAWVWVGVVIPYLNENNISIAERIGGVTAAAVSLWLVFSAARLALGPGARTTSFRPLGIAAALGATSQALASTSWGPQGTPAMLFGGLSLLWLGTTAMHPTMALMTETSDQQVGRMTLTRVMLMTSAIIASPLIITWKAISRGGDPAFYGGLVLLWVASMVLVMMRVAGLVRARERMALTEHILSQAAAKLVTAANRESIYGSATEAMSELTKSHERVRVSVALCTNADWTVVNSQGYEAEAAVGRRLIAELMQQMFAGSHNAPTSFRETIAPDNPLNKPCAVVAAPLLSQGQPHGALLVSSLRPLHSITIDAIGALANDVARAVDAVDLSEELHKRQSEQRFRALVEHSEDVILVAADNGNITFASPAAERLLGIQLNHTEINVSVLIENIAADCRELADNLIKNPTAAGKKAPLAELRFLDADKNERWFEATATDLRGEPTIAGIVINAKDISERRSAELQRDRSEARFRSLVQHASDLTLVFNSSGIITYASPSAAQLVGRESSQLIDNTITELLDAHDTRLIESFINSIGYSQFGTHQLELRIATPLGGVRTFESTLTDLRSDDAVSGIVLNAHDITDRKTLENDLQHKVLHDDLTGIANRVLFRDRVEHALSSRKQDSTTVTAVLFIDIDDFKTVNDGLGHDLGDTLLRVISFRLEAFVRAGDTAARLGGDEFALLLENMYSTDDVAAAAQRLLEVIATPVDFGPREIAVTASVGVALADNTTTNSDELLRNADMAMYHAKQLGKNRVKVFDHSMYVSTFERLELKGSLSHALINNELSLAYQPIVSLPSRQLLGFEALMRWSHPQRGLVSPASFIPIAEETGLIVEIGAWALHEALAQLAVWHKRYELPITMSVNVSPRQLQEERILSDVREALGENTLGANFVTLELTESAGLDDESERNRFFMLRQLGCEFAADDFGTGFASYAALQQLPFTNVKIDRSLITGLSLGDQRSQAQVKSIIEMGHAIGLTITAEGIEDARQADALAAMGADKAQGYLFGRPMSALEAEERLRRQKAQLPLS